MQAHNIFYMSGSYSVLLLLSYFTVAGPDKVLLGSFVTGQPGPTQ